MKKYNYFKIKEVQDWEGEYWDAYEARNTQVGITIYQGWPYAMTPRDGIGGQFSYILTAEVADFVKAHSIHEVVEQLGLSLSIAGKFRRLLGITQKRFYRDNAWLLEHQNEILHDSLITLKNKYGFTKPQVYQQRKWLAELIPISTRARLRKTPANDQQENWYQLHKEDIKYLCVDDIAERYQISKFIALKYYNRVRQEQAEPTYSEQFKQSKQQKQQWLLDHQEQLLNPALSVDEIAQQLHRTKGQILKARAKLRDLQHTPKVKDQNREWLLKHQEDLLNAQLSNEELAVKLNLNPNQVMRKKGQLKKLLNLPTRVEQVHAWRLKHQDILLSRDLSIAEISNQLNCSEKSIIKHRMILRKVLNLSAKEQKKAWLEQHCDDFEQLNLKQLQEKYQLGKYAIRNYRQLLNELKQNESIHEL